MGDMGLEPTPLRVEHIVPAKVLIAQNLLDNSSKDCGIIVRELCHFSSRNWRQTFAILRAAELF